MILNNKKMIIRKIKMFKLLFIKLNSENEDFDEYDEN